MAIQQRISREQNSRRWSGSGSRCWSRARAEETEHLLVGRHAGQAPEIDGITYINDGVAYPGEIVTVEITEAHDYDLVGRVVARDPERARRPLPATPAPGATSGPPRRGGLPVVG